ncbi:MAG: PspC domain-containing protein [Prevotella sp.]|nr:PspC domain-containing protein [Prevotella sp.]
MKKNITVNIFGTLYPIDEDAYELLQRYNENMRRYYSHREGGEEIADDVEHRVAELLSEYRSQGVMAITIEHVTEIINRIGDPQQMDADASTEEGTTTPPPFEGAQDNQNNQNNQYNQGNQGNQSNQSNLNDPMGTDGLRRKFFRDPEDHILGGVLSGLSHYFGISDPLLLRVIFVILLFVSFSVAAVLYIIAWVLIPEAVTPEDRLRMYGKPVNAKTLNEELMRGVNNANAFVNNPQHRDTARGCFSALAKAALLCICGFFALILVSLFIALLAAVFGLSILTIFGDYSLINIFGFDVSTSQILHSIPTWLSAVGIISALLVIGLPLYALIRLMVKRDGQHMNTTVKAGLILVWILSLGLMLGCLVKVGHSVGTQVVKIDKKNNTHNGIYLPSVAWKLLERCGWSVEKFTGATEWVGEWGILPNGEHGEYISLKVKDNPSTMSYDLRKSIELQPGTYKIEGWTRADGEGNSLYVLSNDNKDTLRVVVPEYKEEPNPTDTTEVVLDSNDGSRRWSHVEGTFVLNSPGKVNYGITNKVELNTAPWNSRKIDICDVKIVTE